MRGKEKKRKEKGKEKNEKERKRTGCRSVGTSFVRSHPRGAFRCQTLPVFLSAFYIPIDPRPAPSSLCHPSYRPSLSAALSASSSLLVPPRPSSSRSISRLCPSTRGGVLVARAVTLRVIYLAYLYARLIEKSASVKCFSSFLCRSLSLSLTLSSSFLSPPLLPPCINRFLPFPAGLTAI